MDNFHIDITYEGEQNLRDVIHILFGRWKNATGYRISPEKGLIFYWVDSDKPGYSKFPFKVQEKFAADFIVAWLKDLSWDHTADFGWCDHDGDNGKGWQIYNESWGHVDGEYQAWFAVKPKWAWYGK